MKNEDSLIHTVVVGVVRDEARRGDRIAKLLRKLQFSGWSVYAAGKGGVLENRSLNIKSIFAIRIHMHKK